MVSIYSQNLYCDELFDIPNRNRIILNNFFKYNTIVGGWYERSHQDRMNIIHDYQNEYLTIHKLSSNIEDASSIFDDNSPPDPTLILNDSEQNFINNLPYDKPILVVAAGAGDIRRVIPSHVLQYIIDKFSNDYTIVQIGKSNANRRNILEPPIDYGKTVINAIDKISLLGNLELIKRCAGVICSESSMLVFSNIVKKKMLVCLYDKNQDRFGFIDKSKRSNMYFSRFDSPDVICCDFNNGIDKEIEEFKNIL